MPSIHYIFALIRLFGKTILDSWLWFDSSHLNKKSQFIRTALYFLSSLNETYIEFRKQTSHLLPKYSCVLLNQAEVSNLWFADTSSADSRIIRADMRGGLRQHWRLSNSGPVGVERSVGCWSFDRVASFPSKKTDTKLNVEYLLMGLRCSQQMDKQSVQKNQIDQVLLNNSAQCLFQFV